MADLLPVTQHQKAEESNLTVRILLFYGWCIFAFER